MRVVTIWNQDGFISKDYVCLVFLLVIVLFPAASVGTPFYYGMYKSFATGDTVITTTHANGGTNLPHRKWQVECFDGEAVVGIGDNIWDFIAVTYVWCKFMFPFKPPTQGLYPYYPHCHIRDYTKEFFCYSKQNHTLTVNTFWTGFWSSNAWWWTDNLTFGVPSNPVTLPYKCCRTPRGYYIDYVSCYYITTHDLYWEYYDGNYFLVQCATGYVMTGSGVRINPIHGHQQIDWIQCCRIGWGSVIAVSPPIIQVPGRPPAYTTSSNVSPMSYPQGYAHQYRKKRSVPSFLSKAVEVGNNTVFGEEALTEEEVYKLTSGEKDLNDERNKMPASHYDVPPSAHDPLAAISVGGL